MQNAQPAEKAPGFPAAARMIVSGRGERRRRPRVFPPKVCFLSAGWRRDAACAAVSPCTQRNSFSPLPLFVRPTDAPCPGRGEDDPAQDRGTSPPHGNGIPAGEPCGKTGGVKSAGYRKSRVPGGWPGAGAVLRRGRPAGESRPARRCGRGGASASAWTARGEALEEAGAGRYEEAALMGAVPDALADVLAGVVAALVAPCLEKEAGNAGAPAGELLTGAKSRSNAALKLRGPAPRAAAAAAFFAPKRPAGTASGVGKRSRPRRRQGAPKPGGSACYASSRSRRPATTRKTSRARAAMSWLARPRPSW